MSAVYKFRARIAKTGEPIKVEIVLGGVSRGFTSDRKDDWMVVELSTSGHYSWYAKYYGNTIDSGESSGGTIDILY